MLKNATVLLCLVLFLHHQVAAQAEQPLELLTDYLKAQKSELGLTARDISNYEVSSELVTAHNKLTHLYLQQVHQGIPVHNAILNANLLPNGEILSVGNRFVGSLAQKVNTTQAGITPTEAVGATLDFFVLTAEKELVLAERISEHEVIFQQAGIALEPLRVKLMYQIVADGNVRLVWNVDLYQLDAQHWWQARVDALTGDMLDYNDLVTHCEFSRPSTTATDYCSEEHVHDNELTSTATTILGPGDSTNAYRVFPFPLDSPLSGGRELVVNPAEPTASPFGWHDADGEEGAEYTITRGNNVHAYTDVYRLNESIGDEPDGGDSLCFDFPLDLSIARPYTAIDAAATNLFYWNNIIHDIWFQYGFDEAAGNFQEFNYSNQGDDSDYVRAEVLDGNGTDNANFATPVDGQRPRMQMFLWDGNLQVLPSATHGMEALAPADLAGTYGYLPADFGAELPAADNPLIGEVVLINDGDGNTADGCQTILNADDLDGKIAFFDTGNCGFDVKALAAQEAGAIAVVVCNTSDDFFFQLGVGQSGDEVDILVVGVELEACNTLRMNLPNLQLSIADNPPPARMVPVPGPTGLDSDYDNGIIVHEYTHGISNRLTGGRSQSGCLGNFEQAGEGWSDWFGLAMNTTSANTADEPRGVGNYADGQAVDGDGIRTHPYSRDMGINPDTYEDIEGEGSVHRKGSVWCAVIWDMYWNLVDEYGFDDDVYFGTGGNNIAMQLVVDGLKLQPCSPTFLEARDAIIEADIANNDGVNECLIWETFARRGMGVDAIAGGIENFDKPIYCPATFRVEKTAISRAEAGDVITYELTISNGRSNTVTDAVVIDRLPAGTTFVEGSSDCNITEVDGELQIDLGDAASLAVFTCTYQVQTATAPFTYVNFEDRVTGASNWVIENPVSEANWQLRVNNTFTGIVSLFARNVDFVSDQYLMLEEPVFLDGFNPGLRFYHKFRTEANADGGVVEISIDGGDTWEDVGTENFLENGYTGNLIDSDNPINTRDAFTGNSGDFIRSLVDLTAYAGETVRIRFRLGTNTGGESEGWFLDDIALFGNLQAIVNTACTDNAGEELCNSAATVLYEPVVATEEVDQDRPLSLYPNPTTGQLTVALPNQLNETVVLQIVDMAGRVCRQANYTNFFQETLDLEELPSGVYMLQLRTETSITTRRVIIQ